MEKTQAATVDQAFSKEVEVGFTLEGVDQWPDIMNAGPADTIEIFGSVESVSVHGDKTRESSTGSLEVTRPADACDCRRRRPLGSLEKRPALDRRAGGLRNQEPAPACESTIARATRPADRPEEPRGDGLGGNSV